MIRIRNLHKVVSGRAVLRGIDLTVERGEVLAVVGPAGSGKSVLLRHAAGLMHPDRGEVVIAGRSISQCTERERDRIRGRIGLVSPDSGLLDSLTVRENLLLGLDGRACERSPIHAADRIAWALDLAQLGPAVLSRQPRELSHCTRQRVAIARAVIDSPAILLFDEPGTQLEPLEAAAISALIVRCHDLLGASSLVVTRDRHFAAGLADRVVSLSHGKIDRIAESGGQELAGAAGRPPKRQTTHTC